MFIIFCKVKWGKWTCWAKQDWSSLLFMYSSSSWQSDTLGSEIIVNFLYFFSINMRQYISTFEELIKLYWINTVKVKRNTPTIIAVCIVVWHPWICSWERGFYLRDMEFLVQTSFLPFMLHSVFCLPWRQSHNESA